MNSKIELEGDNTMLSADVDVNANVNPPQAEVRKIDYTHFNINDFKTPRDVCDYMKSEYALACGKDKSRDLLHFILTNIVSFEQNYKFEEIEEMFKLLANTQSIVGSSPLEMCVNVFWADDAMREKVIDLLEMLIGFGKKDARYFGLVEYLLTHQRVANQSIPMACTLTDSGKFEPCIMKKLPEDMQKSLRKGTFYVENHDTGRMFCYSLLTYELVYVD